jgi:hypothetical protein
MYFDSPCELIYCGCVFHGDLNGSDDVDYDATTREIDLVGIS